MTNNNPEEVENLIKNGFVADFPNPDDYVVVTALGKSKGKLSKSNRYPNTKYAVPVAGLTNNICDITLKPRSVTFGPKVIFVHPDGVGAAVVDVINPGVLQITRGLTQGIFNSSAELGYNALAGSPVFTEWNADGWSDLTDLNSRTYVSWVVAINNNPPGSVGQELVMRDTITGKYYAIKFTQWSSGNLGGEGGFAYERREIFIDPLCKITFSDGTTMDTAPVPAPPSANTWDVPGVAFVSATGDDGTAIVGDGNKPYFSISAALAASSTVFILPGEYYQSVTPTTVDQRIYCFAGVKFVTGGLTQTSSAVNMDGFQFLGHATFLGSSVVNLRPGSMNGAIIEIDRFTSAGSNGVFISPVTTKSVVDVRIGYIEAPSNSGAAPNISFRDYIAGNIHIDYVSGYYKVVNLANNKSDLNLSIGTLICKDLGSFGNAAGFKSALTIEGYTAATDIHLNVTVGKATNERTTASNDPVVQINDLKAGSEVNVKIGYAQIAAGPLVYCLNNPDTVTVNVELTGKSLSRGFLSYGTLGMVTFKNSVITQAVRSQIQSGITFLNNTTIYNTGTEDTVYSNNSTGKLILNNVGVQGDPAAYIYNGAAGCTYGFNNVISNQAVEPINPVNDYAAPGIVVEPNYLVPKI